MLLCRRFVLEEFYDLLSWNIRESCPQLYNVITLTSTCVLVDYHKRIHLGYYVIHQGIVNVLQGWFLVNIFVGRWYSSTHQVASIVYDVISGW